MMREKEHKPRVTWMGRIVRGRRLDRNALRRGSDRAETVIAGLLVAGFAAAAPFAVQGAGSLAYAAAHRAQLEQEASLRQVPARVLRIEPTFSGYPAAQTLAQARWTAPDGQPVTGQVSVSDGTAAGAATRVWVSRDGQPAAAPLLASQVSGQMVIAEVGSGIILAFTAAGTSVLARRLLDKHRMAAWDADWRATSPRWTQHA